MKIVIVGCSAAYAIFLKEAIDNCLKDEIISVDIQSDGDVFEIEHRPYMIDLYASGDVVSAGIYIPAPIHHSGWANAHNANEITELTKRDVILKALDRSCEFSSPVALADAVMKDRYQRETVELVIKNLAPCGDELLTLGIKTKTYRDLEYPHKKKRV